MSTRVHDEKCDVAVAKIVVMLSWNACVVVTVPAVDTKSIFSICERRRVLGLAGIVVDKL